MPQPPNNPTAQGPPSWVEIKKSVLNYQAYLRTLSVDPLLRRKAFLIDKETIDRMFALGTGSPMAIRFYIGSEPDGTGLRLFPVACEQRTDGTGKTYFGDINIPEKFQEDASISRTMSAGAETFSELPEPYEARPCPSDCSNANFLNPQP